MQVINMLSFAVLFALRATAVPMPLTTGVQCSHTKPEGLTIPQVETLYKSHQKRQTYWLCRACNEQFKTRAQLQRHKDTVVHP
ncbi:uncharacterized protein PgNI_11983 [Pyricularia grisea]|uniref:C2H2-type domain-containing protein n=1 Tax=Pyricularia grisea TaxID=148305 RepID=A0A6P8AQW7_PYRGI|nr:uncharacterized protein PgNI_11983 [Pyricularia grisea]TLD04436.1 hypothetical protein PgNI_11983 [Pyricularia grisea]